MTPTITAFAASPDRGRGLARDMQVRWALEEAGLEYKVRLLSFDEMKQAAHRARQPFGQIPTYEEGNLVLFESGAIVLHIAQHHAGLLPDDPGPRARAVSWMFAAQSTIEPPIVDAEMAGHVERQETWFDRRLQNAQDRIRVRLHQLSDWLADDDWLEGGFSAGDLMMVSVLRRLGGSAAMAAFPNLASYVARAEARPAFERAFAAQLAVYRQSVGDQS